MNIVQINATYGIGSTGAIARDLHTHLLESGNESYVFWASACSQDGLCDHRITRIGTTLDHKLHALCRRLFHNQGWNSRLATMSFCRRLHKLSPDLVHLHNLHSNYINLKILLRFLAKKKIAVVLTLHDCWFFTGDCFHFLAHNCSQCFDQDCGCCPLARNKTEQRRIKRQFKQKKKLLSSLPALGVIGVSDWISSCGESAMPKNAVHKRIYNWIDTDVFQPSDRRTDIRQKYGVQENQKLILGVSQGWSEAKGLKEFELLSEALGNHAKILLVGMHSGLESAENLCFLGYTENLQELIDLYSAADVFVNPSRMETFGKVTAESLSCGTPVVAYRNTGTSELLSPETGVLVEDGDRDALVRSAYDLLKTEKSVWSEACRARAMDLFDKGNLLDAHTLFYRKILENVNEGN